MVNIILENLLSTAKNRVLYQTLWSLSLTKNCKPENLKNCENFSIESICDQLMQEITRDEPNPSNFYFSAQLAFGVIQLYRFQIDKLHNQVKLALTSCKATFFEINWLSRIQQPEDEEIAEIHNKTAKKGGKQPLTLDIELIEQALAIPDDTEKSQKKKTNKRSSDLVDPTTVNTRDITIIEKFQPAAFDDICSVVNLGFDEFGEEQQEAFEAIFVPTQRKKSVKFKDGLETVLEEPEIPELPEKELELMDFQDNPDLLRSAENPRASPNYGQLEPTLSNDIMDIVQQHRLDRKRVSENFDISQRLERAKIPKLDVEAFELPQNDISALDENANVVETVNKDAIDEDVLMIPPTSPPLFETKTAVKARKPRQKKRKLIIDKIVKISEQELKENIAQYQENWTEKSPMSTFEARLKLAKHPPDTIFTEPGTRMKICAAKPLLPLFQRNLKILKRKIPRKLSISENESPEPKKRKLRERPEKTEIELELIPEFPPVEVPQIMELPQVEQNDLPEIAGKSKNTKKTEYEPIRETEKWSKEKVVKVLSKFWKKKEQEITMSKICSKTNRIVAAGVFLHLMVLSKEGAIELAQGEGLKIVNIAPGPNINIYI